MAAGLFANTASYNLVFRVSLLPAETLGIRLCLRFFSPHLIPNSNISAITTRLGQFILVNFGEKSLRPVISKSLFEPKCVLSVYTNKLRGLSVIQRFHSLTSHCVTLCIMFTSPPTSLCACRELAHHKIVVFPPPSLGGTITSANKSLSKPKRIWPASLTIASSLK